MVQSTGDGRDAWKQASGRGKTGEAQEMAEIYCFNLSGDVRGYVAALSVRYRIRMIEAGQEKAGLTIRELAAGFPAKGGAGTFEESLLLMDHLDEHQFNGFLDDLKQCTPAYQGFKAIVTRSNRRWTVAELVEELRKEKASLEKGNTEHKAEI